MRRIIVSQPTAMLLLARGSGLTFGSMPTPGSGAPGLCAMEDPMLLRIEDR